MRLIPLFILLLGCNAESFQPSKNPSPTLTGGINKENKECATNQTPTCEDCEHLRYELTFWQCDSCDYQPPDKIEAEIRVQKNKLKSCDFTEAYVCVREFGFKGKKRTEDLTHRYHTREISKVTFKDKYDRSIIWWDTPYLHPFKAGVRVYCLPDKGIYYLSHALTPAQTYKDNRDAEKEQQDQYWVNYRGYYIDDSIQNDFSRQHRISTSKDILGLPQDKVFGKKLEYNPDDTCFDE